jgi:ribonuclease BN (tRNA processing enzyme)
MYTKELVSFAKGADVLLAEATLQNADSGLESMGHMTARRASNLAADAGVGRLVLTHLWPEYDPQKSLEEAKAGFKDVILARTGMTVSL